MRDLTKLPDMAQSHDPNNPEEAVQDHVDSRPTELLVSSGHAQLVIRTLLGMNISASEADNDADLDLAQLTVDSADLARRFPDSVDPMGAALDEIKNRIRGDRQWGWVPTIGRNRLVGHVNGTNGRIIVGLNKPVATSGEFFRKRGDGGKWAPSDFSRRGGGVRVGIVDTELREHEWLQGAWVSPAAAPVGSGLSYRAGHATFVTGLVLTRAPAAGIDVLGVLDEEGRADSWNVAKGIAECGRRGIHVINLSLACYTADGMPPLALARAIECLDPDIVVVAAAGNEGENHRPVPTPHGDIDLSSAPAWPAALDGVIAVAAADADHRRAPYSQKGPWLDVLAPGNPVSIVVGGIGTNQSDGYASWAGTSFAAAQVTGAIAALTVPGRLSARQAWAELRSQLVAERTNSAGPLTPRYLQL